MMYSVTDVAGLNRISRQRARQRRQRVAGMVANPIPPSGDDRPPIGLTMFGVTTPLVTRLAAELAGRFDPLVFHATGTGGQSMEKLVDSGMIAGVLDMTTTEIADLVVGRRVLGRVPTASMRSPRTGVPYVGSCRRRRHGQLRRPRHGARALRRTPPPRAQPAGHADAHDVEENVAIGEFIADKLNACDGPVRFLLPEGGVSLIDAPGQPFHDPDADDALFATIEATWCRPAGRAVERVAANINDETFAEAVLAAFDDVMLTVASDGDTAAGAH